MIKLKLGSALDQKGQWYGRFLYSDFKLHIIHYFFFKMVMLGLWCQGISEKKRKKKNGQPFSHQFDARILKICKKIMKSKTKKSLPIKK